MRLPKPCTAKALFSEKAVSDSSERSSASSSANAIAMQAADWIQRREFWSWSADDEAALEVWLDQALAHRIAFARMETAWNRSARVTALRSSRDIKSSFRNRWISAMWRRG